MHQTKKGGWVRFDNKIRYIPDAERVINIETMKQDIEEDKMIRNRLKEEDNTEANPYQMAILNKGI